MVKKPMKYKKEAIELWAQMLQRAREHGWSTFDDPHYVHPGWDETSIRKAFLDAGWTQAEMDQREEFDRERKEQAPTTSPGVALHNEVALQRLTLPIEKAAATLNIENRDKVHFVVEPKAGPLVSRINVVMTDQSIIAMGSFFTRYCGLVSRVRTH